MFDKVVKLTMNQRVEGTNLEQEQFRDLLSRIRTGDSTQADWKLLLTRQPSLISDLSQFQDAIRLFYSNENVANYNSEQLTKAKPICCSQLFPYQCHVIESVRCL